MASIFISYSRTDRAFVEQLVPLLRRMYGNDCLWFDADIPGGTDWWRMIESQIAGCTVFLFLMSNDALASEFCRKELQYAVLLKKSVVPVVVRPRTDIDAARLPDDLKAVLQKTQHVDLGAGMTDTPALAELVAALNLLIKPAAPPTDTQSRKLEAAMPQKTKSNTPTEVWVKVSLPDSVGLRGELPDYTPSGDVIKKEDVRASTFPIEFPVDEKTGARLPALVCLKVTSDVFDVWSEAVPGTLCGDEQIELELPPSHDSRTVIFSLTQRAAIPTGRARVVVNLFYKGKLIAQTSVSTQMVEALETIPAQMMWALGVAAIPAQAAMGGGGAAVVPPASFGGFAPVVISAPGADPYIPTYTDDEPTATDLVVDSKEETLSSMPPPQAAPIPRLQPPTEEVWFAEPEPAAIPVGGEMPDWLGDIDGKSLELEESPYLAEDTRDVVVHPPLIREDMFDPLAPPEPEEIPKKRWGAAHFDMEEGDFDDAPRSEAPVKAAKPEAKDDSGVTQEVPLWPPLGTEQGQPGRPPYAPLQPALPPAARPAPRQPGGDEDRVQRATDELRRRAAAEQARTGEKEVKNADAPPPAPAFSDWQQNRQSKQEPVDIPRYGSAMPTAKPQPMPASAPKSFDLMLPTIIAAIVVILLLLALFVF